jgi:predicted permease
MGWIADGWRRILALTRLGSLERGLEEELRFHIDQQTEKNRRAGLPPDEARRQALLKFGAIDRVKEGTRDQFRPVSLDDLLRDLRYVVRALRRAPGFTATALMTLALGIGATTAVFSVVYAVLLKPLPYPHAETLVSLEHTAIGLSPDGRAPEIPASLFFTYQDGNRTFQTLGLWSTGTASVTGSGNPEEVRTLNVSDGTLRTLGVPAMTGRWFSKDEMTPGSRETAMLTFGYWQRRYGGDRSVIGRRVTVNTRPRTIVGVMPARFRFLDEDVDLILPDQPDRKNLHLGAFNYRGIGRLRPGVTLAQADADLTRLVPAWLNGWPSPPGLDRQFFARARLTPAFMPLSQAVVDNVSDVLWVLLATIGLVLLIACANVANLLLVRAEARQQELAIRAALGAGWARIARECLLESLVLALSGGALGLGLAYAALRLLVVIGPATLPRMGEIAIDPTVLAFTLVVSTMSGFVFGIVPVAKHGAPQLALVARGSSRTSSGSRARHRARNTLVVLQVALALVLLVASGLLVRTFLALRAVQPGFAAPSEVQLVHVGIPEELIANPEHVLRVQAAMRDRLAAIPGVSAASFANAAPLEDSFNEGTFVENARGETETAPIRRFKLVAPGFLSTVGTPLVCGRDIAWPDIYQHRPVALVSENLARLHWHTPEAALGKRIRENPNSPWREVVGVAADVHEDGMQRAAPATVYLPVLLSDFWGERVVVWRGVTFAIRSSRTGREGFLDEIQQAMWSVNASVPVARVLTLGELYDRSMAQTSFALVMLAIAGTMALVLGVVGIYGVIAYAITQRTKEIGIRVALGAPLAALKRMFVRQGLRLAALGIVCGLAAAVALTRIMSFLLFDISPLDPVTYLAGSLFLLIAAAVASYVPARQTTSVDPIDALRAE